jgi:glycyl-tRNA synthetase beta chain
MKMNQTLLIELLTEELPPKALAKLADAFCAGMINGLKSRAFLETDSVATSYATPRRLAVSITNVRADSPDKSIREKVLPASVALDANGNPTAPLAKKLAALANSANVAMLTIDDLERAPDGKADSFFHTYTAPGSALQGGLQQTLDEAIAKLPIPKLMSYQRPDGSTVQFVRPVHKLIALHGADIIPISILGLTAGNVTLGHRFLSQGGLTIAHPDGYASTLEEQGKVIAGIAARKEKIRNALLEKAGDDRVLMPESLLDEVTALVEWPVVYECNFERAFLSVPQECLILTMQTNQKYFALTDAAGKLRSRFLIVSNLETADPQHIIQGNERVVRPRLSDAKFFFEQDKKKKLADRLPGLANVVYHNKLGTQAQRTERVKALAGKIAGMMNADVALAERGALLAKTDLLTDMVGEFPELQGIMGTYYARHDGEPEEVARAISEHYQPRFAGDALPVTATGAIVALADKLETLVGIWSIGLFPTGEKDPFALRRHALGILRILMEKKLSLSIRNLIQVALDEISIYGREQLSKGKMLGIVIPPVSEIYIFILDRLRYLLRDRGYSAANVEAVLSLELDNLDSIIERLDAVNAFAALPEAEALAAANKRITNILKKTAGAADTVQTALLQETAEKNLHAAMTQLKPQADAAFANGDFTGTLKALAALRQPVDAFFTDVMVMADDERLRNNRIALLLNLHGMMNRVADISKLAV